MKNIFKSRANKIGKSPGYLVYIGDKKVEKPEINIIDYNENVLNENEITVLDDCYEYNENKTVTWINIEGINAEIIEKLGTCFNVHPLVLEDILNTDQRPKLEAYDNYIYIVLRMLHYSSKTNEIISEQVSIIFSDNYIISIQEGYLGDTFNEIRTRLKKSHGRIRKLKSDYLLYTLLDAIVDSYFIVLEKTGEKLEEMEDILLRPEKSTLHTIHGLKTEMLMLRKSVWPLREVLSSLEKEEDRIQDSTRPFLRDVYDHTIHVIDTIETYRDMISGMLDIYLSSISNRINEVMKLLTIITVIFIPLTFIAGVYGMNFDTRYRWNMPELRWEYGYPAILLLMALIVIGLLLFFKRKKWL